MEKNFLHQETQKRKWAPPIYTTHSVPGYAAHRPRFHSTVEVNGLTFKTDCVWPSRKAAEFAVSAVAVRELKLDESPSLALAVLDKNFLQMYCQKMLRVLPQYQTDRLESSEFVSTVSVNDHQFRGDPAPRKKLAENNAAKVAMNFFRRKEAAQKEEIAAKEEAAQSSSQQLLLLNPEMTEPSLPVSTAILKPHSESSKVEPLVLPSNGEGAADLKQEITGSKFSDERQENTNEPILTGTEHWTVEQVLQQLVLGMGEERLSVATAEVKVEREGDDASKKRLREEENTLTGRLEEMAEPETLEEQAEAERLGTAEDDCKNPKRPKHENGASSSSKPKCCIM